MSESQITRAGRAWFVASFGLGRAFDGSEKRRFDASSSASRLRWRDETRLNSEPGSIFTASWDSLPTA